MNATALTLLAFILSSAAMAVAQGKEGRISSDPDLAALQQQNAILAEKIKQLQMEKPGNPDPLTRQSEVIIEHARLIAQERSLLNLNVPQIVQRRPEGSERGDDAYIESTRMAFMALTGIAPDVAKALACAGKNIVLYGPAHSEALLSIRTFNDQLELLRSRLKSVLDIQAPTAPDQTGSTGSVFGVSALGRPVLQSVLDLISLFHPGAGLAAPEVTVDEAGMVAVIANAAAAQGCTVYWPDQYVVNPFNPKSQVLTSLQAVADLNDNGGADGKPTGLQQKIHALKAELKRSEVMSQTLSQKIEKEQSKLAEASQKVDALKVQIDFISGHIKDQKNAALQDKLNRTFEKSWEELEAAVKKQLGSGLPGTIEEQGKLGEMSKRMDVLKTRTDWLSQYVKDEKDLQLQDKLKRTLSGVWDQLDAAVKSQQALTVSVPQATEPDQKELKRWNGFASDLQELITTTVAASEAYTTFRGALLDGSSGTSPLNRMLRAEALRDLTFDEKFQARAGSSVVQLKLQKLTGTTKVGTNEKESFSGGVVLSFVQYEPNGKVKNSGVHTAYAGFQSHP